MRILTVFVFIIIVITIAYGLSRAVSFIGGPIIDIYEPTELETISQRVVVSGRVRFAHYLSVNQKQIYPDREGMFEVVLALPVGYTMIEIYARDRRQKEKRVRIPLFVNASQFYDKQEENNNQEESSSEEESGEQQ